MNVLPSARLRLHGTNSVRAVQNGPRSLRPVRHLAPVRVIGSEVGKFSAYIRCTLGAELSD